MRMRPKALHHAYARIGDNDVETTWRHIVYEIPCVFPLAVFDNIRSKLPLSPQGAGRRRSQSDDIDRHEHKVNAHGRSCCKPVARN